MMASILTATQGDDTTQNEQLRVTEPKPREFCEVAVGVCTGVGADINWT